MALGVGWSFASAMQVRWQSFVRLDGISKDGEVCFLLVISRALQELLLSDPESLLVAICGILEHVRSEVLLEESRPVETLQTIVHVERGASLSILASGWAAHEGQGWSRGGLWGPADARAMRGRPPYLTHGAEDNARAFTPSKGRR